MSPARNRFLEFAEAYAAKTAKTLSRDLNALMKRKLIITGDGGYRANREHVIAFLPRRATTPVVEPD